jgi:hypothetical protein
MKWEFISVSLPSFRIAGFGNLYRQVEKDIDTAEKAGLAGKDRLGVGEAEGGGGIRVVFHKWIGRALARHHQYTRKYARLLRLLNSPSPNSGSGERRTRSDRRI